MNLRVIKYAVTNRMVPKVGIEPAHLSVLDFE